MTDRLVVTGDWPGRLAITRGWSRAEARPWNDDGSGAQVRLVRGGSDFLESVTSELVRLGATPVCSPALYPSATRPWSRAGYEELERLLVMERPLVSISEPPSRVVAETEPAWGRLLDVDRESFAGMWRMGRDGLEEAFGATRRATVLLVGDRDAAAGFAIVGAAFGVAYLQRLAVRPERRRMGIGSDLVRAALSWGAKAGARVIVLNVKPRSRPAIALYEALGFTDTGTHLRVMCRHDPEPY